ncbi:hypothetical protein BDQ17DRAFT_1338209 [Cyathus striatus]|nr:hypothetical protein BDQ17DRAFT_1338209 [Cyathus striatus]
MSILYFVETLPDGQEGFKLRGNTLYLGFEESPPNSRNIKFKVIITNFHGTKAANIGYDGNYPTLLMSGLKPGWPSEPPVIWYTPFLGTGATGLETGATGIFALIMVTDGLNVIMSENTIQFNSVMVGSVGTTIALINSQRRTVVWEEKWAEDFLKGLYNYKNRVLNRDGKNISGTIIPYAKHLSETLLRSNTLQFDPLANYSI